MTLESKLPVDSSIQTETSSAAKTEAKPNAPSRGALLRRRIRVGLGMGVLCVSGWVLFSWLISPSIWSITSSQALVNARIMTLYSPIEGTIAAPPPAVGKAVSSGSYLVEITNPRVDNSKHAELKTEAAAISERVAALKKQHEVLQTLKDKLADSARRYQAAAIRRLEKQVEEAKSTAASADAFLQQRRYKKDQMSKLYSERGGVSQSEMVTAKLAAEAAQNKAEQAHSAVHRLTDALESVRKGNYIGPGDGRNDVPYSVQRMHDIDIRQQDIQAKIQEFEAHSAQIQKQLRIEDERVERQGRCELKAPIDGVVWRRPLAAGATVTRQAPVLELLDASDIFVDALVSEKHFGDIRPGDKVVVRLIGSHAEVAGTVRDVLGKVALADDKTLAAEVPKLGKHEIHVIVTFDDGPPRSDNFHPYHIGQPVEVRFTTSATFLKQMWNLVAP
jgi:multidrug resistance efflux pump